MCWLHTRKLLDLLSEQIDVVDRRTFNINKKVDKLMALVQVEQDDLDALDSALDEVATTLETRIEELKVTLPDADLSALSADVEALRNIGAPAATPAAPTE